MKSVMRRIGCAIHATPIGFAGRGECSAFKRKAATLHAPPPGNQLPIETYTKTIGAFDPPGVGARSGTP